MQTEAETSSEFPSVFADDPQQLSPYQSALIHLRQGLQALCDLSPGADAEQREEQEQLIAMQKQVLQLLHIHFSPEKEASRGQRFGAVLRQRRVEAGFTQEQLADYSGLSLSYVSKLEQGDKPPARNAVVALCSVPDLKLVPAEITSLLAVREENYRLAPNWYVSPGFDAVQMMTDLAQQMNGGGGAIEQTHVYLDHMGAIDWIALCNTPSYVAAFRKSMPHSALAKRLREVVGQVGLDLIALGPGDGKSEVRFVQQVLEESDRPNIRFYLLDVSQPLLSRAFKHAADTFGDDPRVFVCAIQGNFHHLPRYMQLQYKPTQSHRRRVYTMLGGTIGNLDNEPQFFQNAFACAAPGDIFIFDATYACTSSSDPAEIQRVDPALSKPVPDGHQNWLSGPIRRYCREVQSVSFSFRLDTNRPLLGSYGLQFIAKVGFPGMRTKEFCMWQVRRYDPDSIVSCMRNLGWSLIGQFAFTGSKTQPKGVFMFQKQYPKLH
jgi:transcriptional regulator with XRE-family HTH domain